MYSLRKSGLLELIKKKFGSENERTAIIKRNILGSGLLRVVNIAISLIVVPLTLNYLTVIGYGIWLTVSSIIGWLSYFDLGFAHGFRNKFAESLASGDKILARKYVTTTYISLLVLFSCILVICLIANCFVNWSSLLNIDVSYSFELKKVFSILVVTFCVNIVSNVFIMMLNADQKIALASLVQTSGQFIALIGIIILISVSSGSLTLLALVYSGLPVLVTIIYSIVFFKSSRYKDFSPSFKFFDRKLISNILGLGVNFFIIMISMLLIFQITNVLISRILGPTAVSEYNVAYKYFNVLHMFSIIILTPCWSAFTEAYIKKDYIWMKNMKRRLEQIWFCIIPVVCLMYFLAPIIFKVWIGDNIHVHNDVIIVLGIYTIAQILAGTYMYIINGIGKVRLQMIVYLLFAIISIPLMIVLGKAFGIMGIISVPILVYVTQSIVARIQLDMLITDQARGIWNK